MDPPGEGVATALLSQEGATVVHPRVRADTHLPLSYMPWAQEPRLHWFWTPACEHCGNQGADATGVPHPGPQSHRPSAHPCAPDSVFKATLWVPGATTTGSTSKSQTWCQGSFLGRNFLVGEKKSRKAQKPLPWKTPITLTTTLATYHIDCRGSL